MLSLLRVPGTVRILFSVLLALAMVLQIVRLYFLPSQKSRLEQGLIAANEIAILTHFLLSLLMITSAQSMLLSGTVLPMYAMLKYVSAAPIMLSAVIAIRYTKRRELIPVPMILPLFLFWNSDLFAFFFLLCNLLLIFRTVVLLDLEWESNRHKITRLSVKEAVDTLSAGILYINQKGRMIIENEAMSHLLDSIGLTGKANMGDIWEQLGNVAAVQQVEDKWLLRIRNGGSWLFSQEEVHLKGQAYKQILALDITNEDILAQEIETTNAALERTGSELIEAIKNIEQAEKAKEILRIKVNLHDMLGQRLSILHHFLESKNAPRQIDRIKALLSGFTESIKTPYGKAKVSDLQTLVNSYAMVGTALHIAGVPPQDEVAAQVLAQIMRECATNALRHGNAKNVYAIFDETECAYTLSMQNDGAPPPSVIHEGGGFQGMRLRLRKVNGSLQIRTVPDFCIIATIPKRTNEEDMYD
jgi:signal transduction histidine kinase